MSQEQMQQLLLRYVSLMIERNAYGGEFALWDAVAGDADSALISQEEREQIRGLVEKTGQWVAYNLETDMLELTEVHAWLELRRHE